MERGTGITTRQMASLKHGGIFIWCNKCTYYPERIAKKLQREDIQIKPLHWLRRENVLGRRFTDIAIDHAVLGQHLTDDMLISIDYIRSHLIAPPQACA